MADGEFGCGQYVLRFIPGSGRSVQKGVTERIEVKRASRFCVAAAESPSAEGRSISLKRRRRWPKGPIDGSPHRRRSSNHKKMKKGMNHEIHP
jgi:hypothetical protein